MNIKYDPVYCDILKTKKKMQITAQDILSNVYKHCIRV